MNENIGAVSECAEVNGKKRATDNRVNLNLSPAAYTFEQMVPDDNKN